MEDQRGTAARPYPLLPEDPNAHVHPEGRPRMKKKKVQVKHRWDVRPPELLRSGHAAPRIVLVGLHLPKRWERG